MDKFSVNNNRPAPKPGGFNNPTTPTEKELKNATDAYEAFYYKKMLEVAYKDMEIMGKGPGHKIYKDMFLTEMSKSTNGQMGISKMLFEHLSQQSGGKL